MIVKAIKIRALLPPKDDLLSVLDESVLEIKEKSVIVVTSKVVSIWEGKCVKFSGEKDELIKSEADLYIERNTNDKSSVMLTIKNNILIPSAGIDESNANGYYILWPEDPFLSARKIYEFFQNKFNLKNFGVIISDSHTEPLRCGISGIGISFYGFYPLRDYRGEKDIFNREMKMSQTNIVDSLAAAAVYEMGEGDEQMPFAVIEDVGDVEFMEKDFSKENPLEISINEDIYSPIIKSVKWNNKK